MRAMFPSSPAAAAPPSTVSISPTPHVFSIAAISAPVRITRNAPLSAARSKKSAWRSKYANAAAPRTVSGSQTAAHWMYGAKCAPFSTLTCRSLCSNDAFLFRHSTSVSQCRSKYCIVSPAFHPKNTFSRYSIRAGASPGIKTAAASKRGCRPVGCPSR